MHAELKEYVAALRLHQPECQSNKYLTVSASSNLTMICFSQVAKLLLHSVKEADEMPSVTRRLEEILEAKGTGGMTALLIAVSKKDYVLIELLMDAGADMNVTDENGDTALIHAAKNKDPSFKYWIPPEDLLSPTLLKVF